MMRLPPIKLPCWLSGINAQALKRVAVRWWELCATWIYTPINFGDALTAPLNVVDLWAYQRNIDRRDNEPEWLYRLRVHHALANAIDAGTAAGMKRIMERLEMPILNIDERIPGYDWDMLRLGVTIEQYVENKLALDIVLEEYRRTCRRWILEVQTPPAIAADKDTRVGMVTVELNEVPKAAAATGPAAIAGMVVITASTLPQVAANTAGSLAAGFIIIDMEAA